MQAHQIVNEEDEAPEITDQQKYDQILEKRQERRAVQFSLKITNTGRIFI